jgi:hypothetical protein
MHWWLIRCDGYKTNGLVLLDSVMYMCSFLVASVASLIRDRVSISGFCLSSALCKKSSALRDKRYTHTIWLACRSSFLLPVRSRVKLTVRLFEQNILKSYICSRISRWRTVRLVLWQGKTKPRENRIVWNYRSWRHEVMLLLVTITTVFLDFGVQLVGIRQADNRRSNKIPSMLCCRLTV